MLNRAIQTNRTDGRVKRGLPVAASMGLANPFLALPTISEKVVVHEYSNEDNKTWLEVAKLCAELVSDDELQITRTTTAREIVSQALSAWATKHCQNIAVLDSFRLVASLDRDVFYVDFEDAAKPDSWVIALVSEQSTRLIYVKNKLETLEKACPGLARTAIEYAEKAGYRTFELFSPSHAFYQAGYIYWCGMDSDEDFISEMGGEEGIDEDTLLPSQFLAAFPTMFFSGNTLDRSTLQRVASPDTEEGKTATVVLSIMDLIEQDVGMPDMKAYYADEAYFSAYVGMSEDDNIMLARVLDDFYQNTGNGDGQYTDLYGIAELSFNKSSFCQWRDDMEGGFLLYQKMDELMQLIGEVKN